jgi:bacillithiol biosynthesis cysteine-adding enzyme BshC
VIYLCLLATDYWILATHMASIQDIPFRKIPRQSVLFLNYLDLSPDALRFYQHAPTLKDLENAANDLKKLRFPRTEMVSILHRQNQSFGCSPRTLDQISELEHSDCIAIVTGQQAGLFTGPLYTIYKALTAIRLAEELRKRGMRAVPVFWMETEDHDLAEVTQRCVLDANSSLQHIDFRNILFDTIPTGSVGSIRFSETIFQAVQEFLRKLPDGAGKAATALLLESTYKPGATFAQSFAELLSRLLPESGLILFDPHDPEAKQLAAPVFQTALRKVEAIRSALISRNREIENAGFHAQVSILENSTVLFFCENDERRAIEKRDSLFGMKNTDRTFHLDQLLQLAAQKPEKFSPNVLLRPLTQDHLFPTAAYVGGSAEIAYFAQIEVLYRLYGRPMPVIWPRDSFTLVEPEIGAAMDRLGIDLQDCFQGKQFLMEKGTSGPSQASTILEKLGIKLDRVLTEMKPDFQAVEAPLAQALETASRKMQHNIRHLKLQVARAEGDRNSPISDATDFVLNHCYPNQTLQERELGIQHFIARRGPSLLNEVRSAMDVGSFAHRVIRF